MVVEQLRNNRSGERIGNVRRRVERVDNHSVPDRRGVRDEDGVNVTNTTTSNSPEYLV